jgi:hypothetical protein
MFTLRKVTQTLLSLLFLSVFALTAQSFAVFADGGAGDDAGVTPASVIISRDCPDDVADCGCRGDKTSLPASESLNGEGAAATLFRPLPLIPCHPPFPIQLPASPPKPAPCPEGHGSCGCEGAIDAQAMPVALATLDDGSPPPVDPPPCDPPPVPIDLVVVTPIPASSSTR